MRTLELMLLLDDSEAEDVKLFREKIPELSEAHGGSLTDFEIKSLYEMFSEDRYSAQWLGVQEPWVIDEFREWLLKEEHKTED